VCLSVYLLQAPLTADYFTQPVQHERVETIGNFRLEDVERYGHCLKT